MTDLDDPLRPPALRAGDRVALVSPSGPIRREQLDRSIALLEGWGLTVTLGRHALDRHGYLAGTDADRLADLDTAFRDPSVRAVLCTRGGYGVQRIVDDIDPAPLRRDPIIVLGFSDITALHLTLWRTARLATLHGPALTLRSDPPPETVASLHAALFDVAPVVIATDPTEPTRTLTTLGQATGRLTGGNLAMLAATVGTSDTPDTDGTILLLEDIAELPYKVDRMLTHLDRAGLLGKLAGVAVGQFTDCAGERPTITEVLAERLHRLGVPVLGGLPVGHGTIRNTVPLGTPATLDATAGTLTVTPAVRARPSDV